MHAFVSHSSKDAEFAFGLVDLLEAEGIASWIAPRNIPTGSSYAAEILKAIEDSRCVALIFTEQGNLNYGLEFKRTETKVAATLS